MKKVSFLDLTFLFSCKNQKLASLEKLLMEKLCNDTIHLALKCHLEIKHEDALFRKHQNNNLFQKKRNHKKKPQNKPTKKTKNQPTKQQRKNTKTNKQKITTHKDGNNDENIKRYSEIEVLDILSSSPKPIKSE